MGSMITLHAALGDATRVGEPERENVGKNEDVGSLARMEAREIIAQAKKTSTSSWSNQVALELRWNWETHYIPVVICKCLAPWTR
jgi:hypothetical protein